VNSPTPSIVGQAAVRRLPRVALWLFCLAYVVPGFWGRDPWRSDDISALGYMLELARGSADWFYPKLAGEFPATGGLLPYWLGAWSVQFNQGVLGHALSDTWAARLPFVAMLVWTLSSVWYGIYSFAQNPRLQPVAFAFGGEANPKDYAQTLADGGLLAFIACLGLAQLSHETTPALVQLSLLAWLFCTFAVLPLKPKLGLVGVTLGLVALTLSGAPNIALALGLGCTWALRDQIPLPVRLKVLLGIGVTSTLCYLLGLKWNLVSWHLAPPLSLQQWQDAGSLLFWFTWPAWPMAAWSVWSWRQPLDRNPFQHPLLLPLVFTGVTVSATVLTGASDKALLLSLPAWACLAAMALPTLQRSVSALIDWFTLLFFTCCGFVIWVIWIAIQTGVPQQPAANVARLAPDFSTRFEFWPFLLALMATLCWAWLVRWRVGRHRAALWKSMVLPAGGAALCWLLLTTLWMPLLNHARSYNSLLQKISNQIQPDECVQYFGLPLGLIAGLKFQAQLSLEPASDSALCPWLLVNRDIVYEVPGIVNASQWKQVAAWGHPKEGEEDMVLFSKVPYGQH